MGKLGKCVIFGCGKSGQSTLKKLISHYDIIAFCDNSTDLYGTVVENIPVVSISQMLGYLSDEAIIVVSNQTQYRQISVQLNRLGIRKVYIMNDGFSYLYGEGEMYPFSLLPKNEYFIKKKKAFSVLYVQYYPNIRTSRIAKVIKELNCEISIAYYKETHQKGTIEIFGDNKYCFSTYNEFINWVNNSDFDIIHVANRNLVTTLLHSNKKIVLDVQDLFSLYKNLRSTELADEFIENSFCDGMIYTHEAVRDIAVQKYGINKLKTHIVENFTLSNCIFPQKHKKLSDSDRMFHIVYEGDIAVSDSRERDFASYWNKLTKAGVHIHIYSALIGYPDLKKLINENPYIHFEGNLSSEELASEMTKYDCGWMVFNTEEGISKVHLDNCSTNKLFEYLNSGLPVIVGDSKCHREFVEKYNCGGTLDLDGDIISQLKQISSLEIPDNFIEKNGFTMENQAKGILTFYKSVAGYKEVHNE